MHWCTKPSQLCTSLLHAPPILWLLEKLDFLIIGSSRHLQTCCNVHICTTSIVCFSSTIIWPMLHVPK
jgi:hypothetical protein